MADKFSSHADYMAKVADAATGRQQSIDKSIASAFQAQVQSQQLPVINFKDMTAAQLAAVFEKHPDIVKSVLYVCNVAGRAIVRDLGMKGFDTYNPRFKKGEALKLAEYVMPFLPPSLPVASLGLVDRIAYIDKEIRKGKGNWEKEICQAANTHGAPRKYKKTKFPCDGQEYELDAASYSDPQTIEVGIDVKRVESPRDIHKRTDEIINKAAKFKKLYPKSKFGVVAYYPFAEGQEEFRKRAKSEYIDGLVFANDEEGVIEAQVRALLEMMGVASPIPSEGPVPEAPGACD
jgi:hypothetical protein